MATNPGQVRVLNPRRIVPGVHVKVCVWECVNHCGPPWEADSDSVSVYEAWLTMQREKDVKKDREWSKKKLLFIDRENFYKLQLNLSKQQSKFIKTLHVLSLIYCYWICLLAKSSHFNEEFSKLKFHMRVKAFPMQILWQI